VETLTSLSGTIYLPEWELWHPKQIAKSGRLKKMATDGSGGFSTVSGLPCRQLARLLWAPADAPGLHLETCHTGCYVPLTSEQANRLPAIFRMSRKQDRSYCRRRRRDINVLCAPVDAARDVTFSSRRRESFQHQSSQQDEQKDSQHLSSKRVFTQLRPLRGIGPIEIPVVVPDGWPEVPSN
jgi:hypothetical protein